MKLNWLTTSMSAAALCLTVATSPLKAQEETESEKKSWNITAPAERDSNKTRYEQEQEEIAKRDLVERVLGKDAVARPMVKFADDNVSLKIKKASTEFRYRLDSDINGDELERLQLRAEGEIEIAFFQDRVALTIGGGLGDRFSAQEAGVNTGILDDVDEDIEGALRKFFLTVRPNEGVELSVGQMGVYNGANSESTGLDNDGYIVGYRAKIKIESGELVVTTGNLNVSREADAFDALFDEDDNDDIAGITDGFNYFQAYITQQLGQYLVGGLGYVQNDDNDFLQAALHLDLKELVGFLDSVSVEALIGEDASDEDVHVIRIELAKKFKNVIAGKDIAIAIAYVNAENKAAFEGIGTYVLEGDSIDVKASIPNLVETEWMTAEVFVRFIQSLDEDDLRRLELGFAVHF